MAADFTLNIDSEVLVVPVEIAASVPDITSTVEALPTLVVVGQFSVIGEGGGGSGPERPASGILYPVRV